MNLKIASWNIEGRLTNDDISARSTPDSIISEIKKINADILVLPEAHNNLALENLNSRKKLEALGYKIHSVKYNDDTPRRPEAFYKDLSIALLSKLPVEKFEIIRPADQRSLILANIKIKNDKSIRVIGLHLDDRSEKIRINQINGLIPIISSQQTPTIIMGDFNAMHGEDLWPAKFLRSSIIKFLAKIFSKKLGVRATEMAIGTTIKSLEKNTNLPDADPNHRPTTTPKIRNYNYLPSIRLMQIDHIFTSPEIKISNFQIAADGGSDHRAISANIKI
jgi:endonuclease/exonuclease/phosphatase family metal-dependent hydrolase